MSTKILLVNDQISFLSQATQALAHSYDLVVSNGIAEAIAVLRKYELVSDAVPFDLIICAVHLDSPLNNFTVFDLLASVRASTHMASTKFLLLSFQPQKFRTSDRAIRLAASSFGGAEYAVLDHFDRKCFLELVESHLPESAQLFFDWKEKRHLEPNFRHANLKLAVNSGAEWQDWSIVIEQNLFSKIRGEGYGYSNRTARIRRSRFESASAS